MSNIFDRIRKNKRKIFIFGGILTTGYAAYRLSRYIQNYSNNNNQETNNTINFKIQKAQYFQSMLINCEKITEKLLENLEEEIESSIDSEQIAESLGLRNSRFTKNGERQLGRATYDSLSTERKLQLWQKLKVLSFTKLTVLLFCWSYMAVTVEIQMAVLAGHLFSKENSDSNKSVDFVSTLQRWIFPSRSNEKNLDENFQKEFINFTLKQLKQQQIPRWVELINTASLKVIGKLSLKKIMTIEEIVDKVNEIREIVKEDVFALCLQGLQSHNSNREMEGPMYITMMDVFQSSGLSFIGQLSEGLTVQLGQSLATGSQSASRVALAKFVPSLWSVFSVVDSAADEGKKSMIDCVKQFSMKSEFRLMIFKTYESCVSV